MGAFTMPKLGKRVPKMKMTDNKKRLSKMKIRLKKPPFPPAKEK